MIMSLLRVVINPIKAAITTILYPFSVPIQILFTYPFPIVYPHHHLKQAKRDGLTINDRWVNETDLYPVYLKTTNYRFRGVIGIDMERCTGCRRCERICPNKIIRMVPRSDEEILERFPDLEINAINKKKVYPEIYYGRCLYCGYCGEEAVGGCPFDALNLTNLYDVADVFDDNLIFTPERLQQVVEKVGRGTRNFWTQEVKKPKAKAEA
jgi:formate hydrogenlyase subunit 6/NADH:ubiquinone oxidoreductase subunit I